jgi:hypothetical protein
LTLSRLHLTREIWRRTHPIAHVHSCVRKLVPDCFVSDLSLQGWPSASSVCVCSSSFEPSLNGGHVDVEAIVVALCSNIDCRALRVLGTDMHCHHRSCASGLLSLDFCVAIHAREAQHLALILGWFL